MDIMNTVIFSVTRLVVNSNNKKPHKCTVHCQHVKQFGQLQHRTCTQTHYDHNTCIDALDYNMNDTYSVVCQYSNGFAWSIIILLKIQRQFPCEPWIASSVKSFLPPLVREWKCSGHVTQFFLRETLSKLWKKQKARIPIREYHPQISSLSDSSWGGGNCSLVLRSQHHEGAHIHNAFYAEQLV